MFLEVTPKILNQIIDFLLSFSINYISKKYSRLRGVLEALYSKRREAHAE